MEPDKDELQWQIAMARASQRRHAEWSWPAILVAVVVAALGLVWIAAS